MASRLAGSTVEASTELQLGELQQISKTKAIAGTRIYVHIYGKRKAKPLSSKMIWKSRVREFRTFCEGLQATPNPPSGRLAFYSNKLIGRISS